MASHEINSQNLSKQPFYHAVNKAQWTKIQLLVKEEGMRRNGGETKDADYGQRGGHTSMHGKRPCRHEKQATSAGMS